VRTVKREGKCGEVRAEMEIGAEGGSLLEERIIYKGGRGTVTHPIWSTILAESERDNCRKFDYILYCNVLLLSYSTSDVQWRIYFSFINLILLRLL